MHPLYRYPHVEYLFNTFTEDLRLQNWTQTLSYPRLNVLLSCVSSIICYCLFVLYRAPQNVFGLEKNATCRVEPVANSNTANRTGPSSVIVKENNQVETFLMTHVQQSDQLYVTGVWNMNHTCKNVPQQIMKL